MVGQINQPVFKKKKKLKKKIKTKPTEKSFFKSKILISRFSLYNTNTIENQLTNENEMHYQSFQVLVNSAWCDSKCVMCMWPFKLDLVHLQKHLQVVFA